MRPDSYGIISRRRNKWNSPVPHSHARTLSQVGNGIRGPPSTGSLEDPFALCIDSRGRLLITCLEGFTILRWDPTARTLNCSTT